MSFSLLSRSPYFLLKKVPCIFCDVSRKPYFCIRFRQRGHGCFDMMVCRMPQAAFVSLYFPPLSHRERRREIKKIKKTSAIIWKIPIKVLTFASAFPLGSAPSIFEQIYINNTSSTRARLVSRNMRGSVLGKTEEPSMSLTYLITYGVRIGNFFKFSDVLDRANGIPSLPLTRGRAM